MVDSLDVSADAGQSVSAAERGRVTDGQETGQTRRTRGGKGRTRKLTVRFSDAEFAAIQDAAEGNPSRWVRDVVVSVATTAPDGVAVPGQPVGRPVIGVGSVAVQAQMLEVMKARAVLAAIGNNVNQIAKGVNAGQPLESEQAVAVFRFLRAKVNLLDAEVHRLRAVTAS